MFVGEGRAAIDDLTLTPVAASARLRSRLPGLALGALGPGGVGLAFIRERYKSRSWSCALMKLPYAILVSLWPLLGFPEPLSHTTTRLEARIVDDATGEPLAARVAVTNPDGKFVEIEGRHEHVQYLGKRWCYVDGSFALTIPESGAQLEIRRGFETRPLSADDHAGDASGKTIQKTFRLRRWIDMRSKGYLSGDFHAHLPVPKEAHAQMLAEDLNALTLLYVA